MQPVDDITQIDSLIQRLERLGEDKYELEKWKQVFLAMPSEEQKQFLTLLNNQAGRLSKLKKKN